MNVLVIELLQEQDDWFKREQELLQKIDEVSENNQKVLNEERVSDDFTLYKMGAAWWQCNVHKLRQTLVFKCGLSITFPDLKD